MDSKELRKMIREAIASLYKESDLITKDTRTWEDMKEDFKNKTQILLKNIDNDNYSDVDDIIGDMIGTLKIWRGKIRIGIKNIDKEKSYQNSFDRFELEKSGVLGEEK